MRLSSFLRAIGFLVLMLWVFWFFASEVEHHWNELSRVHIEIRWQYILVGEFFVVGSYLVATWAWRDAILLASKKKFALLESVGLLNISQLTKYLPGKLWSYAIQMHLLSSRGVSKTLGLSVNLIMLLSLVGSAAVIGFAYLALANTYLPQEIAVALFAASLVFYVLLVFGGTWSINILVRIANKLFKKQLSLISIPIQGLIVVHSLYLISNLLLGLAGYFVALGIGLHQDLSLIVPIAASILLSDTIGFFAFIVPGGIGVREGVMYAMLKSAVDVQTCFMLPVAFRLVTTICDLLLGGMALVLLNSFTKNGKNRFHLENSGAGNEK